MQLDEKLPLSGKYKTIVNKYCRQPRETSNLSQLIYYSEEICNNAKGLSVLQMGDLH